MAFVFKRNKNVDMVHTSVYLKEAIEALRVKKNKWYIDCTYGEGGHSKAIKSAGGNVLAIDWDESVIDKYKNEAQKHNIILVYGNYANIVQIAKKNNIFTCDGILLDLGLSMAQIKEKKRGFSYKNNRDNLDMRISKDIPLKASDIINSFSKEQLYEIFTRGSEELNSWAIASSIVQFRGVKKIKTIEDMICALDSAISDKSTIQKEKIYRRIFQALTSYINNERDNITKCLSSAKEILNKNGKIVVLTFHAGHERLIKLISRNFNYTIKKLEIKQNTKKVFERSATLRILT